MSDYPRIGLLCITGWFGATKTPVVVVGETKHRYRIETLDEQSIRLAGRCRRLRAGDAALIPKYAIEWPEGKTDD